MLNRKNMIPCRRVNFAEPVDPRVKIKESKKTNKYLSFAKKLKKGWDTETSPENVWRFAVTQILVNDQQIMLVKKTCKK